jgi:CRP/FNR family transcriptional regulator
MQKVDSIVSRKRPLKRGEYLFRSGTPLRSLFAVRTGFLKTTVLHNDGREQVTGFHMMGELLGLDAIGSGQYESDAVALEDCEICEIPFELLEKLTGEIPALQKHLYRTMSREIARDYGVMMLLGSMRAEERLAAFLANLSKRFALRGYAANCFHLRMTREEIGSYLGLKLETVSRAFSRFQEQGMLSVQNKNVEIRSPERIQEMLGHALH